MTIVVVQGANASNSASTSADHRNRMLSASERLQKTSDRLKLSKQQLAEAEVRSVVQNFNADIATVSMSTVDLSPASSALVFHASYSSLIGVIVAI